MNLTEIDWPPGIWINKSWMDMTEFSHAGLRGIDFNWQNLIDRKQIVLNTKIITWFEMNEIEIRALFIVNLVSKHIIVIQSSATSPILSQNVVNGTECNG
jgi:hypothetical protein